MGWIKRQFDLIEKETEKWPDWMRTIQKVPMEGSEMEINIKALSDRITEIEKRLGIKTEICVGYCQQPTSDPGGMCQVCRERERQEDAKLARKFSL